MRYVDPSGHVPCLDGVGCGQYQSYASPATTQDYYFENSEIYWNPLVYGVTLDADFSEEEQRAIMTAVRDVARQLGSASGESPQEAFKKAYNITGSDKLVFEKVDTGCAEGCWARVVNQHQIRLYGDNHVSTNLIIHELGHAFNAAFVNSHPGEVSPYNTLFNSGIWVGNTQIAGYMQGYTQPGTGTNPNTGKPYLDSNGEEINANHYWRTDLGYPTAGFPYQQNRAHTANEDFADMFLNWTLGSFANNPYGDARNSFMSTNMAEWLKD